MNSARIAFSSRTIVAIASLFLFQAGMLGNVSGVHALESTLGPSAMPAGVTSNSDDDGINVANIERVDAPTGREMPQSNADGAQPDDVQSAPSRKGGPKSPSEGPRWVNQPWGDYDCQSEIDVSQARCELSGEVCNTVNYIENRMDSEGSGRVYQVKIDPSSGSAEPIDSRCVRRGAAAVEAAEAAGEPVVVTVEREEFDQLPVEPLVFQAGPELGWLPVNMDVVLYATAKEQQLDTELLGTPVSVRAIPTSYTWDMGNGDVFTTSGPGRPYPDHTIARQYKTRGWYDVSLTTTFRGEYSVDGGPWIPIDGTIERRSEPQEVYARSMRSKLVSGPTDEDFRDWQPPARTPETEGPTG